MSRPSLHEPPRNDPSEVGAPSTEPTAPPGPEVVERVRQLQRMALVGQLAAAVAHDFNNVIQAVMGYTSFALEELPEGSSARGDLEHVLTVSSRGATLIRQLLVLARREGVESERVDVGEVVNELSKLLRRAVGEPIEFSMTIEAPPHPVNVDRGQLEQALVIAVLSAHAAMPAGGRLRVLVRHSSHATTRASGADFVELCISDTRQGEDRANLERRLDPSASPTDLGPPELADLSRFAARYGGFVTSTCDPQAGAEVRIALPLARAQTEEVREPLDLLPAGPPLRVLLAEDDEQIRKIAVRALEKGGFGVAVAVDGEEALALFRKQPDELAAAVLDIVMPKLSGTAVFAEIRRVRPGLPVVLTSGYGFEPVAEEEGANTLLLPKPYSPKSMAARLRELIARAGARPG